MFNLILPIFRNKLQFILSLMIFIILFTSIMFIISMYNDNHNKINKTLEKIDYRKISVTFTDKELLDKIKKIKHIEKIEDRNLFSDLSSIYIYIDIESNVNYVIEEIKSLNLNPTIENEFSTELESYKNLDTFYKIFTIVLSALIITVFFIEVKLILTWDNKNIIFMKILGYNSSTIANITIVKVLLPILISLLISSVIFICMSGAIISSFKISVILTIIITTILICLIEYPLLIYKIHKMTISDIY